MSGKLTPKQRRFVSEYQKDLNATQAAIRAGYSAKTAAEIGYEYLRKPQIAAAVAVKAGKHLQRVDISAERILDELGKLGFDNPAPVPGALAAKVKSLELLGKYQKLFTERIEHDVSDDIKQGAVNLRDVLVRASSRAARLPNAGGKARR